MTVSEQFKSTIKAYLDNMAAVDSLFAPVYQKPTKNIDNCITYILNQVKKSGCCGFSDDEIFGMALHYYQEDNIEVGSPLKCHVELSEEEKKAAREAAIKKLQEEELAKLKKRQQAKRENNTEVQTQLTLF